MFRVLPGSAFALACIAFTLPFGTVASCDGSEVRFTGVELATFSVEVEQSGDPELRDSVEKNAGLLALATLACAAAGLVLTSFALRGAGPSAAVGLAGTQVLFFAILASGDAGGDVRAGYWLALAAFVVAALACLVHEIQARRRHGRTVLPAVFLATAVVLPPLGLAVAVLAAALVWMARRLGLRARSGPAPAG
jgi:hypothetical protein